MGRKCNGKEYEALGVKSSVLSLARRALRPPMWRSVALFFCVRAISSSISLIRSHIPMVGEGSRCGNGERWRRGWDEKGLSRGVNGWHQNFGKAATCAGIWVEGEGGQRQEERAANEEAKGMGKT
jgi:hypothetical protein